MTEFFVNILIVLFALAAGFFISAQILKGKNLFNFEKKAILAKEIITKSEEEAKEINAHTKITAEQRRQAMGEDAQRRESRINKIKENLEHKENNLFKKEDRLNELRLKIASFKEETQSRESAIDRNKRESLEKLTTKTGLSQEEMKAEILNKNQAELETENLEKMAKIEEGLKENAVKSAKKILVNVIQRLCSPTSVETKTVLIKVPRDAIKGKIVGKEGKNIEEFEKQMDVDVIFNDLPQTISISAFNLVNRRIAQVAMERLVRARGDIDKQLIGRAITEAKIDTEKELYEIGNKVLEKMGIKGLDKELVKTIGRLEFRTSYGQNIMKHSMEVAWVATMIGSELGLNVEVCKVGGFLHDLGKAIDQNPDIQGAHDFLTKELMEKYGFSEEEVHAAWTHHDSEAQRTPEALIVKAADAVSAGRPGARQESLQRYLDRIKALEATARTFDGVRGSYAISAGREVRVLVDPEQIDDSKMSGLAKSIAGKIEEDLSYPGKIKVNVIRRTDHLETAR